MEVGAWQPSSVTLKSHNGKTVKIKTVIAYPDIRLFAYELLIQI